MGLSTEFDIFLSHNSRDKSIVLILAELLKNKGLRPWIDDEQILPGDSFQKVLNLALQQRKPIAICLGSSGLGPWQDGEMEVAIDQSFRDKVRVIPILLPGLEDFPQDLLFLKSKSGLQFRSLRDFTEGDDDSQTLKKLVKAIKESQSQHKQSPNVNKDSSDFKVNSEVNSLREKIKILQEEKKAAELRLQNLDKQIREEESKLENIISPELAIILQLLLNRKELSNKYGKLALKNFPELKSEVEAMPGELEQFCLEIDRCLELICYALKFGQLHCLDALNIEFLLTDNNRHKYATSSIYKTVFDILRKDLGNRISGEVKTDFLQCIGYLLENEVSLQH